MSSDASNAKPAQVAKPVRSFREKLLVRGGTAILLLLTVMEGMASHWYTTTLKKLTKLVAAEEKARRTPDERDLRRIARGWYFQSSTQGRPSHIVQLRWPSAFKAYVLQIRVADGGSILEFSTNRDLQDTPSSATVARIPVDAAPEQTVVLNVGPDSRRVLVRELVRQAFLMTARDEFLLSTRDAVLRETLRTSQSTGKWPFHVEVKQEAADILRVEVLRITPQKRESVFLQQLTIPDNQQLQQLTELAEGWSTGEFVKVLSTAGYVRKPAATPSPEIPFEHIQPLLAGLNPVSQFAALRLLHEQLARNQDSVAMRAALARGYAMLGSLTERHWSVSHKSFKARALLSARRCVRQWPDDPVAWWTQAYVRALCGLHQPALDDIARARQLGGEPPAWAEAVEAFAGWDTDRLSKAAAADPEFAAYLQLLALEVVGPETERLTAATQIWQRNGHCFRAADTLANETALGIRNTLAAEGLSRFESSLAELIPNLPNLPASVRSILEKRGKAGSGDARIGRQAQGLSWLPQLVETLMREGEPEHDDHEPSWQVLASVIDDALFVQVMSLLDLERFMLAVDTHESIKSLHSLLPNHPLSALLKGYDMDIARARAEVRDFAPNVPKLQFSDGSLPLFDLASLNSALGVIRSRVQQQNDDVVRDLVSTSDIGNEEEKAKAWPELVRLAPDCPATIVARVQSDWKNVEPMALEWEQRFSRTPLVLESIATQYERAERLEDAERCLLQLTQVSPEPDSFWSLVRIYAAREDWESQKRTLQQILKVPSYGLEHARAASALAYGLMNRGAWTDAQPYADQAAASYSAWGLFCAADCYEGLRLWDRADEFHRACAERYANTQYRWYFWCRRTGQGDLKAARRLADRSLELEHVASSEELRARQAVILELDGELESAYGLIVQLIRQYQAEYYQMLAAILAHKMGRTAERDEWIRTVADGPDRNFYSRLAEAVLNVQQGKRQVPSSDELEWYVSLDCRAGAVTNYCYFAGKFLQILGDERAVAWLTRCASSPQREMYTTALAGAELQRLGHHEVPQRSAKVFSNAPVKALKLLQEGFDISARTSVVGAGVKYAAAAEAAPGWLPAHYWAAVGYVNSRQWDAAEREYSRVIEGVPGIADLYNERGKLRESNNDPKGAIADYVAGLEILPFHSSIHNNLGWLLAACPDDEIRNGKLALEHAMKSSGQSERNRWIELALLAAAHAELGHFDKAVQFQQEAIAATPPGRRTDKKMSEERLKIYLAGQPYRRLPERAPLLATLPKDGSWVRYDVEIRIDGEVEVMGKDGKPTGKVERQIDKEVHQAQWTMRAVGQFPHGGEQLQCLEFELTGSDSFTPPSVHRLLIPALAFGPWKDPLKKTVRTWIRKADGAIESIDGLSGDSILQILTGATSVKALSHEKVTVSGQANPLECDVFSGGSRPTFDQDKFDVFLNWTIQRSPEVPFGLVGAALDFYRYKYGKVKATLKLRDHGSDARAAMPELVP